MYGSNALNPYRDFARLTPVASIQDGVEVYEGTFRVPLASALSYVAESSQLVAKRDFAGAVAAAEEAVAIAPDEYELEVTLGDALAAAGRQEEAKVAYRRALDVVKTMDADAQETLRPKVEKKIAGL